MPGQGTASIARAQVIGHLSQKPQNHSVLAKKEEWRSVKCSGPVITERGEEVGAGRPKIRRWGGAREGLAKSVKIWAVVSEEIICCDYSPEEAVVSP